MKFRLLIYIFSCFSFLVGCKESSNESVISLDGYHIEDGFDLQVVASEPLINSPIAIDFDNQGRLWVLEMPGYMPNIDGTGEEEPVGRIMILEDKNKDGHFEKAKTFLDGLVLARAMKLCYGGVLYAEPPNLWFVEIDKDQAAKKTLVDAEYVIGGNVEHQPNGLDLNIDNWVYSAKGVFRYRLKNGEWLKEKTSFRGQWGISHDNWGRLFYNDNSNPLFGDFVLPNLLNQHPHFKNKNGENEIILKDRSVYPIQATAVNRGYIDGMLDENNYLKTFTSACAPVIYRGGQFDSNFKDNAFVCAPEVNLIKRIKLSDQDIMVSGKQAYKNKEFLISEDEAFRPVNLYNGPDGAMYVVDFHNGIIQHKVYMTAYLRELYQERGLDTIVNFGRILKVSQQATDPIILGDKTNPDLVRFLNHKNGWVRDRAQQLLIEKKAKEVVPALKNLALSEMSGLGPIHALWTLEGLDAMDAKLLAEVAKSPFQKRVIHAVQLAELFYGHTKHYPIVRNAMAHQSKAIDLQVSLLCGKVEGKIYVQAQEVLERYPSDTMIMEATLSNMSGKEKDFHYFLTVVRGLDNNYPIVNYLESLIRKSKIAAPTEKHITYTDTKTVGLQLYRQHCSSCHGEGGKGIKNLAPPIYDSEYIKGDPQKLILLTLHGMQGPVTVNGQRYELNAVMPGLKDNRNLKNQDIANILSFVRNAFANEHKDITAAEVKAGRKLLPKNGMYTEGELEAEGILNIQ